MDRHTFFDIIMTLCDWKQSGDDDKVLHPLVTYLSRQPDEEIFSFDDLMAALLFELDTRRNFERASRYYEHSDDSFLYARCCALLNGEEYYDKVKAGKVRKLWTMEFEAILSVPMLAWAEKHRQDPADYPHITEQSYETGSNPEGWS